jgi:hypothetical protein
MLLSNIDVLTLAFGFFNILRLGSYLPQIVAVARDQSGATAISFSCWSIWIGANSTTSLYAWVKLADTPLALISGFNAACCTIVLLLAIYKRGYLRRTSIAAIREDGACLP